jgi:hypothetical protein
LSSVTTNNYVYQNKMHIFPKYCDIVIKSYLLKAVI